MARVFTITEGLENMGALKTGGQGSVYKGRRIGEIITAIKLLPTPVFSETLDDKNFSAFQNEVNKLKKVNEEPNPNVVKILNSGITDSGNFPFIEMEFIEGPDLEELLKSPHDPIFTIHEVLRVADQLSNALAHCHKADVKHGDIKSNNVKFNNNTGNYILLDFGLAIMSDEQRRTSLRQAGAIEFMAPEQNEGQMRFETDIYSFGVVLFELLAGRVPFPLNDSSETGRNTVMVAHLETLPPDIKALRKQALPATWSNAKKTQEMQVPDWLVSVVYKCLEKQPADRFANGIELHKYICDHLTRNESPVHIANEQVSFLKQEIERLRQERAQLEHQLSLLKTGREGNFARNSSSLNINFDKKSMAAPKVVGKNYSPVKTFLLGIITIAVLGAIVYALTKNTFHTTNTKKSAAKASVAPTRVAAAPAVSPQTSAQLKTAKQFLASQKLVEALIIYNTLARQEVPEAMYQYGKLALQNKNPNITCTEAFDFLKRAAAKNYAPAKRSLGFLYAFADDKQKLQESYYYERCTFGKNINKGSQLLMEAVLEGDTAASRLLDELNSR